MKPTSEELVSAGFTPAELFDIPEGVLVDVRLYAEINFNRTVYGVRRIGDRLEYPDGIGVLLMHWLNPIAFRYHRS